MSQLESVIHRVGGRLRFHWGSIGLDRQGSLLTERQAMHVWRSVRCCHFPNTALQLDRCLLSGEIQRARPSTYDYLR